MSSPRSNHTSGGEEGDDPEVIRYHNCCAAGLEVLYEAATSGSSGAKEVLRKLAIEITRLAGIWGEREG